MLTTAEELYDHLTYDHHTTSSPLPWSEASLRNFELNHEALHRLTFLMNDHTHTDEG